MSRWNGVAETIDLFWRGDPLEIEHRKRLSEATCDELQNGWTVLDAGCGSGFFYESFAKELYFRGLRVDYTGMDASSSMLAMARERFPGVLFLNGSLERIPFRDRNFSATLLFEVVGHLDAPEEVISEVWRVTAGKMLVSCWLGPEDKVEHEVIDGQRFPHRVWCEKSFEELLRSLVGGQIRQARRFHEGRSGLYVVRR